MSYYSMMVFSIAQPCRRRRRHLKDHIFVTYSFFYPERLAIAVSTLAAINLATCIHICLICLFWDDA